MKQKFYTAPVELKELDAETGEFEGYASVYNIEDSDGDIIMPGAFAEAVTKMNEGKRPKMLWQHNPSALVGSWLEMREDDKGLYVRGRTLNEVEKGREARALMNAGELDAMSVGFNVLQEEPNRELRWGSKIQLADLWEISLVTWGANPQAKIQSAKHIERVLRDAGYSRKEATAIASGGYKTAFGQSESGDAEVQDAINNLIKTIKGGNHATT